MTITTRANGEQVNLATVLNGKLEAPILQTEMGLNVLATATGHAVRWNEWSVKHNNDGSFKGIDIADMNLTTSATATKKPVRWDEFSNKHNNDGTFKTGVISNTEINLTASATATGKAIRWDEFSVKFNNDGTFKGVVNADVSSTAAIVASKLAIQKMYKKSPTANPSATINTYGTQVDLTPPTGYVSVLPRAVDIVFGGTFGSETVTTDIIVTFSDATTATISKTATAVGTTSLTSTELMTLAKDDVYINKISIKSKSSIASSVATVTVNHFGYYL